MKVGTFNHNWTSMLKEICNGPWSPSPEHHCSPEHHSGLSLDISDACSGTGVFSKFVEESFAAVRMVFGHDKTFIRNKMACEKHKDKQAFLLAHHEPELLVKDIVELHQPFVSDIREPDKRAAVPATPMFGSGFSCKDFVFFCFFMRVSVVFSLC